MDQMHVCMYRGPECEHEQARLVFTPAEDTRNVLCGLALAYLDDVRAQIDGVASQPEEALHVDGAITLKLSLS